MQRGGTRGIRKRKDRRPLFGMSSIQARAALLLRAVAQGGEIPALRGSAVKSGRRQVTVG